MTLISSPFAGRTANNTLVSASAAALQETGIVFTLDFDLSCFAKEPSVARYMAQLYAQDLSPMAGRTWLEVPLRDITETVVQISGHRKSPPHCSIHRRDAGPG
jgi:hypothetical protein